MVPFSDAVLDKTFSALAHPIRRAILSRLAQGGWASVTDLAEPFDVSVMAVSKHLRVMEEAGLILRRKDGRVQRCTYDPHAMESARDWIETHRRFWERQLDSLAAYLDGTKGGEAGQPHDHPEGGTA